MPKRALPYLIASALLTLVVAVLTLMPTLAPQTAAQDAPVELMNTAPKIVKVDIRSDNGCALQDDGTVVCWGSGSQGQLGDQRFVNNFFPTNQAITVPRLGPGVKDIAVGLQHACAITANGAVKCWGSNAFGQMGRPANTTPNLTPAVVPGLERGAVTLTAGNHFTCATMEQGGARCWGQNANGELGQGSAGNTSLPAAPVQGLTGTVHALESYITQVCAIADTKDAQGNDVPRAVFCWGTRGHATGIPLTVPPGVPHRIGTLRDITDITTDANFTCAVGAGGAVSCWGRNMGRVLDPSRPTTVDIGLPVPISGFASDVTDFQANFGSLCAVQGGVVRCLGQNFSGSLGIGSNDTNLIATTPAPTNPALSENVEGIFGGYNVTAVIRDGRMHTWGQQDVLGISNGQFVNAPRLEPAFPQRAFRDVGQMRIWADQFLVDASGAVTARGYVVAGPAALGNRGRYFQAGDRITWQRDATTVRISGGLFFEENGSRLINGDVDVDTTTGVVNLLPTARPDIAQLGTSSIAVTPTLTLNMYSPVVTATTPFYLDMPEDQFIQGILDYRFRGDGTIEALNEIDLNLKLAGGMLTGKIKPGTDGLIGENLTWDLPKVAQITISELLIDGKGEHKMQLRGRGSYLPEITIDNFVKLKELTASLELDRKADGSSSYMVKLEAAQLDLLNLPERTQILSKKATVFVKDGKLDGSVESLDLDVNGYKLSLKNLFLVGRAVSRLPGALAADTAGPMAAAEETQYEMSSDTAELEIPADFSPAGTRQTVIIRQLKLIREAPYLTLGGAGGTFSLTEPLRLGGTDAGTAAVTFDQISGKFMVDTTAAPRLDMELDARVTVRIADEVSTAGRMLLKLSQGKVGGRLQALDTKVAGLELRLRAMNYFDGVFSAGSATLALPEGWGTEGFTVQDIKLSKAGLAIGGAGGEFAIPNQDFGGTLKLEGMKGSLALDGAGKYEIKIAGTVKVEKIMVGDSPGSVSVKGSLTVTLRSG